MAIESSPSFSIFLRTHHDTAACRHSGTEVCGWLADCASGAFFRQESDELSENPSFWVNYNDLTATSL